MLKRFIRIVANESAFAMAGYSVFRHTGTEADYCFIFEDNICRLIINVQPELKPIKDLLPIVLRPALLLQILLL
jgi:hypothetical protein